LDVTPYQHHGNQAVEYLVAVDVVNHQEPLKHLAAKSLPSTSTPLLRRNQRHRIGNTSGSNVRLITPQGTLTEVSSVGAGLRAQRLESAERCVADATSLKKPIVDQPSPSPQSSMYSACLPQGVAMSRPLTLTWITWMALVSPRPYKDHAS